MTGNTLRQQLARSTPGFVRKLVRMGEHYARRHGEWARVLMEMNGATLRDRVVLGASALAAPVTSLRRLDGFEPPLLLADLAVVAKGVGRFDLRAGTDDIIHVLSSREAAVRAAIERHLGPGDVFVDAGANIGFFSVIAGNRVGPQGTVVAVEMMPQTADRLRLHLAANGMAAARVVQNALFKQDGEFITATSSAQKFGQASIAAAFADDASRTIQHRVETVRLDTALADIGEIALIKMDLEGAEYDALCGAQAVLARTRALVFENNAEDRRIETLLENCGFSLERLDGHDWLALRKPANG